MFNSYVMKFVLYVHLSLIRDNHTRISHITVDLSMNTSSWNIGSIVGQKRPVQISHIWRNQIRLELEGKRRDLALSNMTLDSKLRDSDLVKRKVSDVADGSLVSSRATVLQQKTCSPAQLETTTGTREIVAALIKLGNLHSKDFLFRSRARTNQ